MSKGLTTPKELRSNRDAFVRSLGDAIAWGLQVKQGTSVIGGPRRDKKAAKVSRDSRKINRRK